MALDRRAFLKRGAAGAAGFTLLSSGLLAACGDDGADDQAFLPDRPAAPYAQQRICSLLDENGNGANIRGQDGGTANSVDGRMFWTFGDTLLNDGSAQPNNAAFSGDREPRDCIDFTHLTDATGNASALLPRIEGEEVTVWPAAGQVAVRPGAIHYLYTSVRGADNHLGSYDFIGIGLARSNSDGTGAARVIENLITDADLREGEYLSLTPAVAMLEFEDYVYLYFAVGWNVRVGRVPAASIEDRGAYEYWDGATWTQDDRR